MKITTKIIFVLLTIVLLGYLTTTIDAQFNTGNLAAQVRQIADTETDRFLTALEATVQEYDWKPRGKTEFWDIFKKKLGLDGYAPSARNVRLWERVRAALKTEYDSKEVDTLLDGAIGTLTPLPEDEGE